MESQRQQSPAYPVSLSLPPYEESPAPFSHLAHHITPTQVARQKHRDEHPFYDFESLIGDNLPPKPTVLLPYRDPSLHVIQSVQVGVSPASVPSPIGTAWTFGGLANAIGAPALNAEPLSHSATQDAGFGDTLPVIEHTLKETLGPILEGLTRIGFVPPYKEWKTLVSGSDRNVFWNVLEMLMGVNDVVLLQAMSGFYINPEQGFPEGRIPLLVDSKDGILNLDVLEDLLSTWSDSRWARKGYKKPRLLLVLPTNKLPKDAQIRLYRICHAHDIVVFEFSPGSYVDAKAGQAVGRMGKNPEARRRVYLEMIKGNSLTEMDADGRVIRVDTLDSATDPNCNLVWITCNPLFHKHLSRIQRAKDNSSIGMTEYFIALAITRNWKGLDGLLDRIITLSADYGRRSDACMAVLASHFEMKPTEDFSYDCYLRKGMSLADSQKKDLKDGSTEPIMRVQTTHSGLTLILRLRMETHWRLSKIPRSDPEHTRVYRQLMKHLMVEFLGHAIFVQFAPFYQGHLSLYSNDLPSPEESDAHYGPIPRSEPYALLPNPIGYVVQHREVMGNFIVCPAAKKLSDVEQSMKNLCRAIVGFFENDSV